MELSDLQSLAVAEAMGKAIKDVTNPRGGAHGAPTLRTECDDALRQMYETEGVDRKRIIINGTEVGTLSARVSNPESGVRVVMSDGTDFLHWLRSTDGGRAALARAIVDPKMQQALVDAATTDGELPDGCRIERYDKPAQWLGTTLKVSVPKVGAALGGELPSAVAGLLAGGAE